MRAREDDFPSSAETDCGPRSQPPSLRPSVLLGGLALAARARASDAALEAESHSAALSEAQRAFDISSARANVAMAEQDAAATELIRAQAAVALKTRELDASRAAQAAAQAHVAAASQALHKAQADADAAESEAAREEAAAEAHYDDLVERVLEACLGEAVEEVALRMQYSKRMQHEPQVTINFSDDDVPFICEGARPDAALNGRTLLCDVLGARNIRRVKIDDGERAGVTALRRKQREHKLLMQGLMIDGRRFHVFAFKDDDEGSYVFVADRAQVWHPFVGVVSWDSVITARQLFADFESVNSLPKYTMRPALLLSQTVDMRTAIEDQLSVRCVIVRSLPEGTSELTQLSAPPLGVLQIIELPDIMSSTGCVMTDGGGMLSADLAALILPVSRWYRAEDVSGGGQAGGPLVTQMRLWYHGSVSKGTLLQSAVLPERTIVLRRSMIKVQGRNGYDDRFWAFEVVATSKGGREAYANRYLVALLEAAGGEPMVAALLSIAQEHAEKLLHCTRPPLPLHILSKLAEHDLNDMEQSEHDGELEPVAPTLSILNAGFEPMREPYLHQKLSKIVASQLKKLHEGRFPIPDSAFAYGVPDPSGTLEAGNVCLVKGGIFYMDQPAIIYRHPGLHPGSIRRVRVVPPSAALRQHIELVDQQRSTVIIFSTRGERSLPDEMDGGDMDGDEFALIWNEQILAHFPETNMPACSEPERQLLMGGTHKYTQPTPAGEESRRDAAAWHMVRTRHGQAHIGRFANQWLLVAEAVGASDNRARKLAYSYAAALDSAKMGGTGLGIPQDCQLPEYPSHLAAFFPKHNPQRFTASRATALAKLHALDTHCSMPECELPDHWFHMAHSTYVTDGQPSQQLSELLAKWEDRYRECQQRTRSLPGTDWNDPEKKRTLHRIYEEYRELLIHGYSEDELRWPAADSKLLAEVAAIYAVNHRRYSECRQRYLDNSWTLPSLKFAWHVGGDYLILIKTRQKSEPRPGVRRGAAPVCDQRTATALLAVSHRPGRHNAKG